MKLLRQIKKVEMKNIVYFNQKYIELYIASDQLGGTVYP